MTRTESTVCWLGWVILALIGMYGCAGGPTRTHERLAASPAVEVREQVVSQPVAEAVQNRLASLGGANSAAVLATAGIENRLAGVGMTAKTP